MTPVQIICEYSIFTACIWTMYSVNGRREYRLFPDNLNRFHHLCKLYVNFKCFDFGEYIAVQLFWTTSVYLYIQQNLNFWDSTIWPSLSLMSSHWLIEFSPSFLAPSIHPQTHLMNFKSASALFHAYLLHGLKQMIIWYQSDVFMVDHSNELG